MTSEIPDNNPALAEEIREEIRANGPVSFARFMELALYHPEHGYYTTRPTVIGRDGDFYTSLNLNPVFGWLIAKQIDQMWRLLGSPALFTIAEMGAGLGMLCDDILSYLAKERPECFSAARYLIFERSGAMREAQRKLLSERDYFEKVSWEDFYGASLKPFTGVFVSNELVDVFPVHLVAMMETGPMENHVALEGDKFVMAALPLSDARIGKYLADYEIALAPGQIAEINLEAETWMARAAEIIDRGFAITIDYGYEARKLYGNVRPRGTLLCYHRHKTNEEPLERVGMQDITAHVNFTSLMRSGERGGLLTAGFTNQAFFLINLGLSEYASAPPEPGTPPQKVLNRNFAFKRLIDPDGLGRYGVLVQYKGLSEKPHLDCLKMLP